MTKSRSSCAFSYTSKTVGAGVVGAGVGLNVGFGLGDGAAVGLKVTFGVGGIDKLVPLSCDCKILFCLFAWTNEKVRPNTAITNTTMKKHAQIVRMEGVGDA